MQKISQFGKKRSGLLGLSRLKYNQPASSRSQPHAHAFICLSVRRTYFMGQPWPGLDRPIEVLANI
jgi:hypothetical protein